ncbi:hypothetical protein KEM56_006923 [Ascosphaera pollenicola]|nr:hypothetical protein KEM56_006923 [Ascosphaera pollenicola]
MTRNKDNQALVLAKGTKRSFYSDRVNVRFITTDSLERCNCEVYSGWHEEIVRRTWDSGNKDMVFEKTAADYWKDLGLPNLREKLFSDGAPEPENEADLSEIVRDAERAIGDATAALCITDIGEQLMTVSMAVKSLAETVKKLAELRDASVQERIQVTKPLRLIG